MNRGIKQFIYGTFYLAVVGLIGFGVYTFFLKPAPSCTNSLQDRGEEGVDCGGVCGNICLPSDLRPISVQSVRVFSPMRSNLVAVLAKLQNPNTTLAAKSFSYTLDLYDALGTKIKTITGNEFIYAGEVKYIAEFVNGVSGSDVSRGVLSIQNVEWVKDASFQKTQFNIQVRQTDISTTTIQITGQVVNKDVITIPNAMITAIFYGSGPDPIGISATQLEHLEIEDTRPFSISHPLIVGFNPIKTELAVSARRP